MPATIVRCSVPASMRIFISFFDFGTRSASRIFAARSSTFMKSSIEMRSSAGAGAAACVRPGAVGAAGAAPLRGRAAVPHRGGRRRRRRGRGSPGSPDAGVLGCIRHGWTPDVLCGATAAPRSTTSFLAARPPRGVASAARRQRRRRPRRRRIFARRVRHHRRQQHGGDAHRFGGVEQHRGEARRPATGSFASAHGWRLGDEHVGGVDRAGTPPPTPSCSASRSIARR